MDSVPYHTISVDQGYRVTHNTRSVTGKYKPVENVDKLRETVDELVAKYGGSGTMVLQIARSTIRNNRKCYQVQHSYPINQNHTDDHNAPNIGEQLNGVSVPMPPIQPTMTMNNHSIADQVSKHDTSAGLLVRGLELEVGKKTRQLEELQTKYQTLKEAYRDLEHDHKTEKNNWEQERKLAELENKINQNKGGSLGGLMDKASDPAFVESLGGALGSLLNKWGVDPNKVLDKVSGQDQAQPNQEATVFRNEWEAGLAQFIHADSTDESVHKALHNVAQNFYLDDEEQRNQFFTELTALLKTYQS